MNRVIKEHPINNRSSRSHVIYTLYIEVCFINNDP